MEAQIYGAIGDLHESEIELINHKRRNSGLPPLTIDEADAIRRNAAKAIATGGVGEMVYADAAEYYSPAPIYNPPVAIGDTANGPEDYYGGAGLAAAEVTRRQAGIAAEVEHNEELARRRLDELASGRKSIPDKPSFTTRALDFIANPEAAKNVGDKWDMLMDWEKTIGQGADNVISKMGPLGKKIAEKQVLSRVGAALASAGTFTGGYALTVPGQLYDQVHWATKEDATEMERNYGETDPLGIRPFVDYAIDSINHGAEVARGNLKKTTQDEEYQFLSKHTGIPFIKDAISGAANYYASPQSDENAETVFKQLIKAPYDAFNQHWFGKPEGDEDAR